MDRHSLRKATHNRLNSLNSTNKLLHSRNSRPNTGNATRLRLSHSPKRPRFTSTGAPRLHIRATGNRNGRAPTLQWLRVGIPTGRTISLRDTIS
jgi:hypothetical protein